MRNRWQIDVQFLEQGDIYFFYKPKKGIVSPKNINDVARFYFVLDPDGDYWPRYIVMGNKKMPKVNDGGETSWGFIQMVGGRGFETYKKNSKVKKDASRPAGEGIYAVVSHRDHTHLLYALELPQKPGKVQKAFNIKKEGNYIFLNRAVEDSPKNFDLPFSNYSKVDINKLNQRGTEVLLVGVGEDIGRLGIRATKDEEDLKSADIFSKLKVDKNRHPINSLVSGEWR